MVHGVASSANLQISGEVKKGGLGILTAAIFLAGEMAGSGVLALPNAMVGTGNKQEPNMLDTNVTNVRLVWFGTDSSLHTKCRVQWYKTRPVLDHAGGEV